LPNCGTDLVYLNACFNHSTTPNLRTRDGYHFISLRKIRDGEELAVDYRMYGANGLLAAKASKVRKGTASQGNMHH
jgi:hypothetical protein